jgi:hypothetical protein
MAEARDVRVGHSLKSCDGRSRTPWPTPQAGRGRAQSCCRGGGTRVQGQGQGRRGVTTSARIGIPDAERIKAIYGSVLSGGSDERERITVPPVAASRSIRRRRILNTSNRGKRGNS